ncbi:MAG: putative glycolipid-binding domain-containing protein [Longimicrobiaceae bacterium]
MTISSDAAAGSPSILWRRLDLPGVESARLERAEGGWTLAGAAVFTHEERLCRLYYEVRCDAAWHTRTARVAGFVGGDGVEVAIEADGKGGWTMNGEACPRVDGCIDVDLNFSPSTNLLPIRRLGLGVGEEAAVRAAWLRFPSFALEPLEQRYVRTSEDAYRYESAGGAFVRDLTVNADGFVTRYPGFFESEG